MKVVLDTSILNQENLFSTRMQKLQRLMKNGFVELVLPEMVVREFKTKQIENSETELIKISNSIKSLNKNKFIKNVSFFDSILLKDIEDKIKKIENDIDLWIGNNGVSVIPISNTIITELFDDYFSGRGAFKSRKSRDDIPDAVILDGIKKKAVNEKINVVMQDRNFKKALKENDNIILFNDLADFLDVEALKVEVEKLNFEDEKVNSILKTLKEVDVENRIEKYLNNYSIYDGDVQYLSDLIKLPDEVDEIQIEEYGLNIVFCDEFYVNNSAYLGNDKYSYDFSADCEVNLTIMTSYDKYERIPYNYRKKISKPQNYEALGENGPKNVYVNGNFEARFEGSFIIKGVDENITPDSLKAHLKYLGSDECLIEHEVQLDKIEIEDIY